MIRPLSLRRLTTERAAALLVTLAPLVYFLPAARGWLVLCQDDNLTFNLPLRVAAANIVRAGHLPLWNPYYFGGMPLLGTAQGGILYPLNWLFLFFSAPLAMNLVMLTTYALAGLGAFLYARRSGASVAGALLTGLVWQWSGFLVAQISHMNIAQTASLLPWLLWAIDGYGATGRRRAGVALAALVALQIFVGHPQTLVYSLLLAAAYALSLAVCGAREMRRAYLWTLLLLAAGVALAAVQILPTLELLRYSARASATYDFFASFSLPPFFLLTFVAPYLAGGGDGQLFRAPYIGPPLYIEFIGYVGLATLMLALLAPLIKRDARTIFWTVAALVCLALAIGRYWPLDLYRLVFYVPVLNLFRVPARHLMEVDFALAVLAGRGLSALAAARREARVRAMTLAVGAGLFLFACLAVTVGRPAGFRLGREAPVTFLRAPELFLPVVLAALSAWALWRLARGRRAAVVLLIAVIALDLGLWGQMSGWRVASPPANAELWQRPPVINALLERERAQGEPYRVLTLNAAFSPGAVAPITQREGVFVFAAQPNAYMMYGIENAAGYDGFGLVRYSRLAGNMKLWGELENAEQSLRESRAFDLLNVRYLITLSPPERTSPADLPRATQNLGGLLFAPSELGLPALAAGARLAFNVPSVAASRFALVSNLSWAAEIAQGETVGHLRLRARDGRVFEFPLRAGIHTSEWAHDRDHARGLMRHERAPVAASYMVEDREGRYEAHSYVSSFALPQTAVITGGEIEVSAAPRAPRLSLSVLRASLIDDESGVAVPLDRSWMTRAQPATTGREAEGSRQLSERWRRVAEFDDVWLYENSRALPRVWLAPEALTLAAEESLQVIRAGRFNDGRVWEPRRTALLDVALPGEFGGADADGRAEITMYEPNRIEIKAANSVPSILILSENHYPGWRAYVDGRAVETLRVNYNLRGVALPPGEHSVHFVYLPESVIVGLVISLAAALVLLLWWRRWLDGLARRVGLYVSSGRAKESKLAGNPQGEAGRQK